MPAPNHDLQRLASHATQLIRREEAYPALATIQYIVGLQKNNHDVGLWLTAAELAMDNFYLLIAQKFLTRLSAYQKKLSQPQVFKLSLLRSRLGQFIADDKMMVDGLLMAEKNHDRQNKEDVRLYRRREHHVYMHLLKKNASQETITKSFTAYEWRTNVSWETSFQYADYHHQIPDWHGQALQDNEILLVCFEQGFGDSFQFARFLPMIFPKAKRILFECHPMTYRFFAMQFDGVHRDNAEILVFPHGQYHEALQHPNIRGRWQGAVKKIFLGSLAYRLGVTTPSVKQPYFSFDKLFSGRLPAKMPPRQAGHKKIGLVWACGRDGHSQDRSAPLQSFLPLLLLPNIEWWSLQMPPQKNELAEVGFGGLLKDQSHLMEDFAATARLLYHLDAVVTVDTAMAHLALALGVKTFLLIPNIADWRWKGVKKAGDSLWYPHHLFPFHYPFFHQGKIIADWRVVIRDIKKTLTKEIQ